MSALTLKVSLPLTTLKEKAMSRKKRKSLTNSVPIKLNKRKSAVRKILKTKNQKRRTKKSTMTSTTMITMATTTITKRSQMKRMMCQRTSFTMVTTTMKECGMTMKLRRVITTQSLKLHKKTNKTITVSKKKKSTIKKKNQSRSLKSHPMRTSTES